MFIAVLFYYFPNHTFFVLLVWIELIVSFWTISIRSISYFLFTCWHINCYLKLIRYFCQIFHQVLLAILSYYTKIGYRHFHCFQINSSLCIFYTDLDNIIQAHDMGGGICYQSENRRNVSIWMVWEVLVDKFTIHQQLLAILWKLWKTGRQLLAIVLQYW